MIIAFAGERKSGKDFLCDYASNAFGANRLSFSDEVRVLANNMFPWVDLYYSPEEKDEPLIHPNNPNNFTPRQIWLQSAKVARDVDPNYFVNAFIENNGGYIHSESNLYIITDFRTPQEYEFLKEYDIPIIKIIRDNRDGIEPDAFEEYIRNFDKQDATFINKMNGTDEFDVFYKEFINGQE